MTSDQNGVYIIIGCENGDQKEIDRLGQLLSKDLMTINAVASVEPAPAGSLPKGAMGSPVDFGNLLVKITEAGAITGLLTALVGWLSADRTRSITIVLGDKSITTNRLTKAEQQDLVEWFKTQAGMRFDRS
jgi:hypothetical protein